MADFEYKVYDEVLEAMENKTKNIEVRLYNEKSSKIRIGDIIKFKSVNDENKYVDTLIKVLSSWIIEKIDNYNSSMYYENPGYIYECYKEGKVL